MDKRTAGLLCLIVAIVSLLVGNVTNSWWAASSEEMSIGVGLTSVEACADECDSITLKKLLPKTEKAFVTFGGITMYGGYVLVLALVIVLVLTVSSNSAFNLISPARIAALLCSIMLLCAIIFVILFPEEFHDGPVEMSVGYSLFLYVFGTLTGLLGSTLISQQSVSTAAGAVASPAAPGGLPVSAQAESVPACSSCGAPTRWVAEHKRFLCDTCRVYL